MTITNLSSNNTSDAIRRYRDNFDLAFDTKPDNKPNTSTNKEPNNDPQQHQAQLSD